jgi:hypothetical protein
MNDRYENKPDEDFELTQYEHKIDDFQLVSLFCLLAVY